MPMPHIPGWAKHVLIYMMVKKICSNDKFLSGYKRRQTAKKADCKHAWNSSRSCKSFSRGQPKQLNRTVLLPILLRAGEDAVNAAGLEISFVGTRTLHNIINQDLYNSMSGRCSKTKYDHFSYIPKVNVPLLSCMRETEIMWQKDS